MKQAFIKLKMGLFNRLPMNLAMAAAAFSLMACNYIVPKTEEPYASESRIEKSFFFKYDDKGNIKGPKTFACGWSFENVAIESEDYVLGNHAAGDHCNVEFEQTENALVGRLVSPSLTNRSDWRVLVKIPIKKHFYYEKEKDGRGRDKNVLIENADRSHWSARPFMELDLATVSWYNNNQFMGEAVAPGEFGLEDVEWDKEKGFLGFTVSGATWLAPWFNTQTKTRVNFLEFETDPTFVKTPVRHENSKYLNILHVIGKLSEGVNPVMYAAHWDLNKKYDIYLHGFPKEYYHIGEDAVAEWNQVFNKLGVQGNLFTVKPSTRKYGFDLRYPSIVWIADKRLSAGGSAPIGIAYNIADVRTGKMIYGGVSIWGGSIDNYINAYSPTQGVASTEGTTKLVNGNRFVQFGLMEPEATNLSTAPAVPVSLTRFQNPNDVAAQLRSFMLVENQELNKIQSVLSRINAGKMSITGTELKQLGLTNEQLKKVSSTVGPVFQVQDLQQNLMRRQQESTPQGEAFEKTIAQMSNDLATESAKMQAVAMQFPRSSQVYNMDRIQKNLGMPTFKESLEHLPFGLGQNPAVTNNPNVSKSQILQSMESRATQLYTSASNVHDLDRRLSDVGAQIQNAVTQNGVNKIDATKVFLKDVTLHELGHMVGLGHNFKENIMPEVGTVAQKSEKFGGFDYQKFLGEAKDNYKNFSTVMGYKSGAVDVLMDYKRVKPGPMDYMVLTFLYKQQYPILPKNATASDDWQLQPLDSSGLILNSLRKDGKEFVPAFFPACNDMEASLSLDVYCNRFDRGYDAMTIVKSYLEDYKVNLINVLYAFTDVSRNSSPMQIEYQMYYSGLKAFGRARMFYDYMRQKYDDVIVKAAKSSSDSNKNFGNLTSFSDACQKIEDGKKIENKDLTKLFTENVELRHLCVASRTLLHELTSLLKIQGSDFTKIDYFDRSITAGVNGGDYRNQFNAAHMGDPVFSGRWTEISRMPVKFPALFALTAQTPYTDFGGFAYPVTRFSRKDGNYHLSTLFPEEYSEALAAAVESNLTVGSSDSSDDSTYLGSLIFDMGYLLSMSNYSNDPLKFDLPYFASLKNQTLYNYSYAIVEVKKEESEGTEIAKKFTATATDFTSRAKETISEIYMFKNNRSIIVPPDSTLMMPLTPMRWTTSDSGYYYAIKLTYANDFFDIFKTSSVRSTLQTKYKEKIASCTEGKAKNGLKYFFNDANKDFTGIKFPRQIHLSTLDLNEYYKSVEDWYDYYYSPLKNKQETPPLQETCENALRAQGLVVMAAAAINGMYFSDILNYMQKGD